MTTNCRNTKYEIRSTKFPRPLKEERTTKYELRITALLLGIVALLISSCHQIEEWDNDAEGNFEALWTVVDQHYCFFEQKGIDWNKIHDHYRQRVYPGMSRQLLFDVCADMVNELRDGHVNLSSTFNTSYYTNWWSDYPQNYDRRLVEQYYLNFDYRSVGGVEYGILPSNIGYISYPSFAYGLGDGNLNAILSYFSVCTGIIIDLRDNGGGNMEYAQNLCRRFLTERTLAGYMINKTGPGHNDLSEPFAYYFDVPDQDCLIWTKPVVVLTNRSTFSAANNFVSVMQYLPNVTIVGAKTGGGSGMPITLEIPCGWAIRMSSVSVLDAKGLSTESGIDPDVAVDLDPQLALQGIDTMIEKAIEVLQQ